MRSVIPFGMSDKALKYRLSVLALFITCIPVRAYPDTVDTLNFTQGGYQPGGDTLMGTFTGTVEPSGLIEARDLTNFFAVLEPIVYNVLAPLPSGGGPFFSYDVNGGDSTLDFIAAAAGPVGNLCVGAAAPLACGSVPTSFGIVVNFAQTSEQPVVTLVSSVTSSPLPEPFSAALIGIGFVAAAFLLRFRHQRARRPQSNVTILASVGLPSIRREILPQKRRMG